MNGCAQKHRKDIKEWNRTVPLFLAHWCSWCAKENEDFGDPSLCHTQAPHGRSFSPPLAPPPRRSSSSSSRPFRKDSGSRPWKRRAEMGRNHEKRFLGSWESPRNKTPCFFTRLEGWPLANYVFFVCYNGHGILPWQKACASNSDGLSLFRGTYSWFVCKESEVGEISKICTHIMKHHGFFLLDFINNMTIHDHIPY